MVVLLTTKAIYSYKGPLHKVVLHGSGAWLSTGD